MKKVLSLIIVISMMLSLVPVFSASAEGVVLWEDNFDGYEGSQPKDWKMSKNGESYLQTETAMSGKALYMKDDSNVTAVQHHTPKLEAVPGELYTATADLISFNGASVAVYIKFYDADGKQLSTAYKGNSDPEWLNVTAAAKAPAGTVTVNIVIAIGSTTVGESYIDNVKLMKGVVWSKHPVLKNNPVQADPVPGQLVQPVGEKLQYNPYNEKGDVISNFSSAGFYKGEYELPDSSKLPVVATIEPSSDPKADDTDRIQKVIDEVYANAENDYFKVIKIKAGRYNINSKGINLKSGIILSGEGQGPEGTVLFAKDAKQYVPVKITGEAPIASGDNHYITDEYVEAGSYEISLTAEDIKNYKVGDLITIYHESTHEWSEAMEMKGIINVYDTDTTWDPGEVAMKMERTITKIEGNTITLDIPLFVPLMKEYSPSYIYKTNDSGRVIHVGLENLRVESYFNGSPADENHANDAIVFKNAKNCYVRDVSCKYFILSAIACDEGAKQITIKNCSSIEPVSTIAGSRRYPFMADRESQQILFSGCYSYSGRHDFISSRPATGPIVFTDSVSDYSNAMSEPHGTWSTGVLYDNVLHIGDSAGYLAVTNHGIYGTALSQGWTGAGVVLWNCLAPVIAAVKPPLTYQNFIIGEWGRYQGPAYENKVKNIKTSQDNMYKTSKILKVPEDMYVIEKDTSFMGNSYKESKAAPVEPRSLYRAQLAEKLTGNFKNVKPNAPVITSPRGELEHKVESNSVTFEGIYEKGAEKVTLYIDNNPYNATLNSADNSFKLTVSLADGVHKVYATQTRAGLEGVKCADRFIVVKELKGNKDYLESNYDYNMLHETINNNVVSFDVYQPQAIEAEKGKIKVKINGRELVSDVDPIETNGRVLVPMRAIFEQFGAKVEWDEATATATASTKFTTIRITENQTTVYVDDKPVTLDVPATIVNGRFLVPVRFISESFYSRVEWVANKNLVDITSDIYMSDNPKHVPAFNIQWSMANGADRTGAHALDGDKGTRWAGDGKGVWTSGEFLIPAKISSFSTLFANQNTRSYNFEIHFSNDGVNFTKAFEGTTSPNIDGDVFTLPEPVEAKYFKFVGQGGSNTDWILLYELEFYTE